MWAAYSIDVFSEIKSLSGLIAGILIVLFVTGKFILFGAFADGEFSSSVASQVEGFHKSLSKVLWAAVVLGVFYTVIPSKTTMYTMVAIKAVDVVSETQEAKRLAPKSVEVVELYLDKIIANLKEAGQEKAAEVAKTATGIARDRK